MTSPDFISLLEDETFTKWTETNGPDSGHGIDRYFVDDDNNEAYANEDQDYWTLSLNGDVIASSD